MPNPYPPRSGKTRRWAVAALLAPAIVLVGCTVGPDFLSPEEKPRDGYTTEKVDLASGSEAKQSLAIGEKIPGDWW